MEENQTVPAMIPEGDFAAFLEGEKVETLLSPLGYAYCAEGQDADIRVKRLERLEVTARQRGATPAQMEAMVSSSKPVPLGPERASPLTFSRIRLY